MIYINVPYYQTPTHRSIVMSFGTILKKKMKGILRKYKNSMES